MKYQIWELKDFQKGNTNETIKENFVLLVNEAKLDVEPPTLQNVLDNSHDLIDGRNSQGNEAGLGSTGYDINAFGSRAAKDNSGDDVNAIGYRSAINNSGSQVNAIGSSSSNNNTGTQVNALGGYSASNNTGDNVNALGGYSAFSNSGSSVNALGNSSAQNNTASDVNALGNASAFNNSGNNVNALGNASAQNNTFNNVNLFGDNTQADEDGQTVFAKTFEIFARLSTSLLTATRKYILPNESGTIALQSYVDAQTGTPTLQEVTSQGNTTTDSINFVGTGINSDSNTNVGAGLVSGITYIGGVQKTFSLSGQQLTLGTSQLSTNVGVGTVRVIDNTDSSTQITTNGLILRETGRSGKIHAPNTGAATFQNDYYLPSATSYPAVRTLATENYVDAKLNPTLNFLPKKGASGFVDSSIFDNGTNVGIGTITPTEKLDVVGNAKIVGTITSFLSNVNDKRNVFSIIPLGQQGFTGAYNVALRTVYPYESGSFSNDVGGDFDILKGIDGNTILATKKDNTALGNVGIRTTTPTEALDVNGSIKLSNLLKLGQFTTATEPAYVKGASFFNTTLNKSKIGGETIYETQITGTGTIGKIQKTSVEGVIGDSAISEDATNALSSKVLRLAAGLTPIDAQDLTPKSYVDAALDAKANTSSLGTNAFSSTSFLPLTGGNLTGLLNVPSASVIEFGKNKGLRLGSYANIQGTGQQGLFLGNNVSAENNGNTFSRVIDNIAIASFISLQYINGSSISFGTGITGNTSTIQTTDSGTRMRLFGTGNLAINTLTDNGLDKLQVNGNIQTNSLIKLGQFTTATEPAYVKGAQFFNTTLNKMRIGGATAYETVTSS